MKFCYLDESGMGEERYLVMAGIIVDATRMHRTKEAWADFLNFLSSAVQQKVSEFHARRFYSGSGSWGQIGGPKRAELISAILSWIAKRKHAITFSVIDKQAFESRKRSGEFEGIPTAWCAAAIHCILGIQKFHQREKKNKGHTVVIFDREAKEEGCLTKMVLAPPEWTNPYYDKAPDQAPLDQIVDVPFFVDSEQALLIQVADTVSYILRIHAEIETGIINERYTGERDRVKGWVKQICNRTIPGAMRYPARGGNPAAQAFRNMAPEFLRC